MRDALELAFLRSEQQAKRRLAMATSDLYDDLAAAVGSHVRRHPWTVPSIGFLAGLAAPWLMSRRDLRHALRAAPRRQTPRADGLGAVWRGARASALDALVSGVIASLHVLASDRRRC